MARCVGDHPETWDEHLPLLLLSLRAARHSVTGFSPAFLATGTNLVLPAERKRLAAAKAQAKADTPAGEQTSSSQEEHSGGIGNTGGEDKRDITSTRSAPVARPATQPNKRPRRQTTTPAGQAVQVVDLLSSSSEEVAQREGFTLLDSGTQHLLLQRKKQAPQAHAKAKDNMLRSQEKQKRDFKKRHFNAKGEPKDRIPVGSLCYMAMPSSLRSKLHLQVANEGPYRVKAYSDDQTMVWLEDFYGKTWSVNVGRISEYTGGQ